jgi:hypothetical protein
MLTRAYIRENFLRIASRFRIRRLVRVGQSAWQR